MKKVQAGFTMIELVIVIVILGILAAVAIPKYIDMKQDAAQAAVNGVAGSMSSAMAVNYAARTAKNVANGAVSAGTSPVADCNTPAVLAGGALPTQGGVYAITAAAIAAVSGTTASCTLTFTPTGGTAVTATFTGIGS